MKQLLILLVIPLLGFLQANAQTNSASPAPVTKAAPVVNPNGPIAKWDKTAIDFGEIPQNVPKTAVFTLTNDGKEPLIIQSAKASCGCTEAKFSKTPVLPGKSSAVEATYNAAAPGAFIKTITVITNADSNPIVLQIKGTVK